MQLRLTMPCYPVNLPAPLSKNFLESRQLGSRSLRGKYQIRRRSRRSTVFLRMSSVSVEKQHNDADPHHHKLSSVQGADPAPISEDTGSAVVGAVCGAVYRGGTACPLCLALPSHYPFQTAVDDDCLVQNPGWLLKTFPGMHPLGKVQRSVFNMKC